MIIHPIFASQQQDKKIQYLTSWTDIPQPSHSTISFASFEFEPKQQPQTLTSDIVLSILPFAPDVNIDFLAKLMSSSVVKSLCCVEKSQL